MLSRKIWVRYQSLEHAKPAGLAVEDWLSEAERRESERYRDESRLRQWQAGRWLAKQLLNEQLVPWSTPWRNMEILSRDEGGRAVRPVVRIEHTPQPWCVSISHSRRGVLVAVSLEPALSVGVDLAELDDLNPQSLVFWFSAREREQLREGTPRQAAVRWAVKEAVYKAVNRGESFVPRKFEVFPRESTYECHYQETSLQERSQLTVWDVDDHVAVTAVVAAKPGVLEALPQIGGKQEQRTVPLPQETDLVGIS